MQHQLKTIRIMLAEDHPGFLAGIRAEIERQDDMEIVGTTTTGAETIRAIPTALPDVLLLDMEFPDMSGLDVLKYIRENNYNIKVLPLSGYVDEEHFGRALASGAVGYLTKDESLNRIMDAIRAVAGGDTYLSQNITTNLANGRIKNLRGSAELNNALQKLYDLGITPRLFEVLKLVADGLNDDEIADVLFVSPHTIRNYIVKLRGLVDVEKRSALIVWAWKNCLHR